MKHSTKWYDECPDDVRISSCGNFELWWNKAVQTSRRLDHNRPGVILIDKLKRHWTIIDFSVPNDKNVVDKEKEKIENYRDLAKEIRKVHKVRTKIVPLVIGSLGVVSETLEVNLNYIKMPHIFLCMQVTAIQDTVIILRKTLSL